MRFTAENIEGAREAWPQALQRERSRSGTEIIQSWLTDLPASNG
jgi:predicted negative regulator of RcsB-dependent stress response